MEEPLAPRTRALTGEQEALPQPPKTDVVSADDEGREEEGRRSPPMRLLRGGAVALVLGLLALLVWATLAASRGQSLVGQIAQGKKPPAPAFTLAVLWPHTETWPQATRSLLAGGTLSLAELRGYPVVLNFWASWCIPCRQEAPLLHAAALAHRGKLLILGLNIHDLSGDARQFAATYHINYVAVRDKTDGTYRAYGLTGVPETFYIDARGRIVAHTPGEVTEQELEQGIAAIAPR